MKRPDPSALRARLAATKVPTLTRPKLAEVPKLDPARREALRATQAVAGARMKAQLQERLAQAKGGRTEKKRRRPWWLLLLLLLLLLAVMCCIGPCEPEAPPDERQGPGSASGPVEPVVPVAAPPRLEGTVKPKPRPSFPAVKPEPVPWLASFRMQVSARSTRLAGCFVGANGPGVLRWTAQVEPETGRVTDQELEPVLKSEQLTSEQRACVLGVLQEPPYRIDAGGGSTRVGMVIEF